ncbi:MAG: YceI family protein [Woeseiaceae bacterium]
MSISNANKIGARPILYRFVAPGVLVLAGIMFRTASSAADLDGLQAPSGSYVNDPGHTRFLWRIEHLGLTNYTARINNVDIQLEFDANDVASSSVTAVIDPRSVDTGYVGEEDFDAKISTDENILNAAAHPTIEFASSNIVKTGPTTMAVTGDLTLLGVTRPVTLDVVFSGSTAEHPFVKVPALGFAATATVDRTEFGLDFLSGSGLGDQLEIEIDAEFIRQ